MLNEVRLICRVGKINNSVTKNQKPVATISVVTERSRFDEAQNKWIEEQDWHNIKAYGKIAETFRDKYEPGDLMTIRGELRTDKSQDPNTGADKFYTYILLDSFPKKLPRYWKRDGQATNTASIQPQPTAAAPMQSADSHFGNQMTAPQPGFASDFPS